MLGTRSNNVSGAVIDQTLSQIDTAIVFFEECLDRVRYEEAERQGVVIAQLTKALPSAGPNVTKAHKERLGALLERLNTAISRFDMETKSKKQNTARTAYSRYN
ncbi:hypothetical protein [Planktotalea sp.]|uniref:hypothetical protein n=1 Tax=Planktotalea sp. TaxID=2029877 RepID=UPI003F6C131C